MPTTFRLEARDVVRNFTVRGRTLEVLKGVSLAVAAGETVLINGRSGVGKSVLLWILSGIDAPTEGDVIFEGKSYRQMNGHDLASLRRERIGMLFQDFNLIPAWTARENVEAALVGGSDSPAERRAKVDALLDRLGLGDRLDHLPAELSVGQQQRVALARALINQPILLFADEPTGNVDPEMALELWKLLRDYVRGKNASLIVTTHGHFPGEAEVDRRLRLQDGRLYNT